METQVDSGLLLDFFLTFSRFEYALKATEFHKRHPEKPPKFPPAEPDWDRFAVSLRDTFDAGASSELTEACKYLLDSPPNQQVICGEVPAWETPVRAESDANIDFLIRMVRLVRNNLFHGGKHNVELHEGTERTEKLLKCSLIILQACLNIAPNQMTAYEHAYL